MSDLGTANKMRKIGKLVQDEVPGMGFAVFVFPFHEGGISNYISNAERKDMITMLEETLERFKKQQDFKTPEGN